MARRPRLKAFDASRGRTVWLDPATVTCVRTIPTKYGDKLLVTVCDGGPDEWLEDTPLARDLLGLERVEPVKAAA